MTAREPTMTTTRWIIVSGVLLALVVLGMESLYVVAVPEYAIVTQFGRVMETRSEPGLYFKTPFVQTVSLIDRRLREWDGEPGRQLTVDKEDIEVNTWARWRVTDPRRFYENLNQASEAAGQGVMDTRIDSAVKNIISVQPLMEVLRNQSRKLKYTAAELQQAEAAKHIEIETGREAIVQTILDRAGAGTETEYGFVVEGVGIKQFNYAKPVIPKIYERMRSERIRIANRYESEGREREARILGDMTKDLERIESEGYQTATRIRGEADAEVIKIYADAYGRDPEFYSFSRTLEIFPSALGEKARLVIGAEKSDFFRYLRTADRPAGAPAAP